MRPDRLIQVPLFCCTLFALCLPCLAINVSSVRCIIQLAPQCQDSISITDLCALYSLTNRYTRPFHGLLCVEAPGNVSAKALVDRIGRDPRVRFVEPDYIVNIVGAPNDPFYPDQWSLYNPANDRADIHLPEAWSLTTGNRRVIIAILDTGIDYLHPDLSANIWSNPDEILDNGIDDDHNGFVDDIHGWNFVSFTSEPINIANGDPMDKNSHGTHVAGTIGAETDNGQGVAGINKFVSLMAVKGLSDQGWGFTSDLIAAIYYAVDNGAMVISASWGGGGYSEAMIDALKYAADHDVIFCAAAGNDHNNNDLNPFYPASYPADNIVAVASFNRHDSLSNFSNYGTKTTDIAAPGSDIVSSIPGNRYSFYSGTSMATPHVSGVLGLMLAAVPGLSYHRYIEALLVSAEVRPAYMGRVASNGRLNAADAILALLTNRPVAAGSFGKRVPRPVMDYFISHNYSGSSKSKTGVTP